MAEEGETQFYRPIKELKERPDCACMFKYPDPIGMYLDFAFYVFIYLILVYRPS